MSTFTVGDKVAWASQSAGTEKRKTGEVVAVLRPGEDPLRNPQCDPGPFCATHRFGGGMPRKHESYVILVQEGNRRILYWPRVSALSKG